eukprot:2787899-Pyramimonas_sp.AAC.1
MAEDTPTKRQRVKRTTREPTSGALRGSHLRAHGPIKAGDSHGGVLTSPHTTSFSQIARTFSSSVPSVARMATAIISSALLCLASDCHLFSPSGSHGHVLSSLRKGSHLTSGSHGAVLSSLRASPVYVVRPPTSSSSQQGSKMAGDNPTKRQRVKRTTREPTSGAFWASHLHAHGPMKAGGSHGSVLSSPHTTSSSPVAR